MREQKGYLFHRYQSWFVRYCDDVKQPDGSLQAPRVNVGRGVAPPM